MGNFSYISNYASSFHIYGPYHYVCKPSIRGITLTIRGKKMETTLSPDMITQIYSSTSLGVSIMLAAAGLGSALGWGLICMKYIEGIARQPEMLPALRIQMFITAGLMESFPFIVLAFAMFFVFANPFIGAAKAALGA